MYPEEPNFKLAAKLWWAHFWRVFLITFILVFLIQAVLLLNLFIYALFAGPAVIKSSIIASFSFGFAISFFAGILVSILVYLRMLKSGFGDFRLTVVKK